MTSWYSLGAGVLLAAALTACGGDSSDDNPAAGGEQVKTPDSLRLSFLPLKFLPMTLPVSACLWSTQSRACLMCWI